MSKLKTVPPDAASMREETIRALVDGRIRFHELPNDYRATEAAAIRREALERICGSRLDAIGHHSFDAAMASQRNCENMIGVAQVPMGIVGPLTDPGNITRASDEQLREAGLSRQKAGYARSLAGLVTSGELDLKNLPADDEEAIAKLTEVKGIGRWSAEIYLLFAEGRTDIWPAGDLAVQIEVGRILGHEARPSEKLVRELAERWRPHRGAAAIFAWHHYASDMKIV